MITFTPLDLTIIIIFFAAVIATGFWAGRKDQTSADDFLLSGRKVGLVLFILTNVSTWYGGILGVGEFTYRYGLAAWFTQGLPYYVFAVIFALFFARKIRAASLFTIPDKITGTYGKRAGLFTAVIVFILVSPAPYLLMTANLISLIFDVSIIPSLIIALLLSLAYLVKGGFRSDLYTDVIQFVVMFAGFILILVFSYNSLGDISYLQKNLPSDHLTLTGGASSTFIIVWFLIAMWTFADPGFHQRCYAAKDGNTAVKGIIISIFFWALFDFLTTFTGLYARAFLPGIEQPVLSFPLLAEEVLTPGIKGFFYAALFATIMSTFNSFLFLSGTTIGRDFIFHLPRMNREERLKAYTIYGLILSGIFSIIVAYLIPSVIEIWYTIGSICIPAIILPVISAYYEKIRINNTVIFIEMTASIAGGILWFIIRENLLPGDFLSVIEPMLVGLAISLLVHLYGLLNRIHRKDSSSYE